MNATPSKAPTEQSNGIIAEKRETPDGILQILVIPNTEAHEISNITHDKLLEISEKRKGAYYSVAFDEFEVGQQVAVIWDGSQEDSLPPQRHAKEAKIISPNKP